MKDNKTYTVALAGNPNVGKSTVFNALTHMKQHTGNWPGKTVSVAEGTFITDAGQITLVDVPGTYSLSSRSPDEEAACSFITGGADGISPPDAVVVVCDACCLERGLAFALQIRNAVRKLLICINLMDEAEKRGISIDFKALEHKLMVPVVPCAARQGIGLDNLKHHLAMLLLSNDSPVSHTDDIAALAEQLAGECVTLKGDPTKRDRLLDRLFTGKYTAFPIAAILCAIVFFITLKGATPLSDGLLFISSYAETGARYILMSIRLPPFIVSAVCDGVLRVLLWVVSVMLPPMAIFFPLFTIIEDLGYLPRAAYNFDRCFMCCGSCGKQALTMMMGVGCNAAGVTGCRIIDSPRERLIAILTNSFMPCNGRLPVIAAFITVLGGLLFTSEVSLFPVLCMCLIIAVGITVTMLVSLCLTVTVLKGTPSAFTLELPPYRIPKFGDVIVRSVFDRTLSVLGRAVTVAAPAGLIIWLLGNVSIGGTSLMTHTVNVLDPIGRIAGMDGVMLCAFILALPASEITLPLMIMGYSAGGTLTPLGDVGDLLTIFSDAGWTPVTAVCAMLFTLIHWPCSTTILTVRRETGKIRYAILSAVIPTLIGYSMCTVVNLLFS